MIDCELEMVEVAIEVRLVEVVVEVTTEPVEEEETPGATKDKDEKVAIEKGSTYKVGVILGLEVVETPPGG